MKWFAGPHVFSNAISPVQCAVALEALRIVSSNEGEQRRQALLAAVITLRSEFQNAGLHCMGVPSAIVPLLIGQEQLARVITAILYDRDVLLNVIEFPAVGVGAARFRMQVMADHTEEQMKTAARIVIEAIAEGRALLA